MNLVLLIKIPNHPKEEIKATDAPRNTEKKAEILQQPADTNATITTVTEQVEVSTTVEPEVVTITELAP